jgi:hypothetical protein
MVNMIGSFSGNGWRLIIFPRGKHRPSAYFEEGDGKILVSPAAVDIGGLVITPIEKDFLRLDGPTLEGIFQEVSVSHEFVARALEPMTKAS